MNFSMFFRGTRYRQATVLGLRGTGILEAYMATPFTYSKNRYEKNTQKNFLLQKFNIKLAPVPPGVHDVRRVLSNTQSNQNNQRTTIYANLPRTICMRSPSKNLERQSTDGTYLL